MPSSTLLKYEAPQESYSNLRTQMAPPVGAKTKPLNSWVSPSKATQPLFPVRLKLPSTSTALGFSSPKADERCLGALGPGSVTPRTGHGGFYLARADQTRVCNEGRAVFVTTVEKQAG